MSHLIYSLTQTMLCRKICQNLRMNWHVEITNKLNILILSEQVCYTTNEATEESCNRLSRGDDRQLAKLDLMDVYLRLVLQYFNF